MQVYTALYHAFVPPLYAGTLYQGLYQVYATRAPLGFIPSRSSSCKSLQHKKTSSTSPSYPQVFINPSILSNMFSLFRSEALRVPKAALASRTITSGTPVYFVFLFPVLSSLTLCRGYAGLCTRLYARLYVVFMLFASAKHCIIIESFTLFMPVLRMR